MCQLTACLVYGLSRLRGLAAPVLSCILAVLGCSPEAMAQEGIQLRQLAVEAGPGSAEPRLSKGHAGLIVLSWLEPAGDAMLLRFSSLTKDGWTPPRTAASGQDWFVNWADFPSVVAISDSLWAAHWLKKRPGSVYAYDVSVAISRDAGINWGNPITPHRDGTATEHGFVSMFPWQDGVGLLWLDGRNAQAEGSDHAHDSSGGMTLRSAVIMPDGRIVSETLVDDLVCDCCQTDAAVGSNGPLVVYRNRSDKEVRDIYLSRSVGQHWLAGQPVANDGWEIDGCPVNGPAVAAMNDDVAVVWFTAAGDRPRVRFARSEDGGLTFSRALDIDSDLPIGRVDVAFLDGGAAAVSWLGSNVDQQGEIRVRIVTPDGRPGTVFGIAQSAVTRSAGHPQLTTDGDSLILAWTATSDAPSRVQTARIFFAR